MRGLMQESPLNVCQIIDYAAKWHPEQLVISRSVEGPTVSYTYLDLHRRSQLGAVALRHLGVRRGSFVATLAWNTSRHMEAWYGIIGCGAVCHTLNPRLSAKDLIYIANDAQVRGPAVVSRYFKAEAPAVDKDNWFPTGDVASIDHFGNMNITDRSKDVIKSGAAGKGKGGPMGLGLAGGEWISSIEIENLAMDEVLLSDASNMALLAKILPSLPSIKHVVLLTDRLNMPPTDATAALGVAVHCYEELLGAATPAWQAGFRWAEVDENDACGMCYTSGTTGNPKGVLYSHRSNYLHALLLLQADSLPLSATSCCLAVVPMFHANSWGLVFAAPMVGARLVLPGPHLDGPSIYSLMESCAVTMSAGVPTVWLALLAYMEAQGLGFSSLKLACIGGAAAPLSMLHAFEVKHGVEVRHLWGMTELSPLGTLGNPKPAALGGRTRPAAGFSTHGRAEEPAAGSSAASFRSAYLSAKTKQGRPHVLCDMRIVDDAARELPHDGTTVGNLQPRPRPRPARPPSAHPRRSARAACRDGLFVGASTRLLRKRMLAALAVERQQGRNDPEVVDGYAITASQCWASQLHDGRHFPFLVPLQDLGGTRMLKTPLMSAWEATMVASVSYPGVAEAAVVATPDERWGERPLLVLVAGPGVEAGAELREGVLDFLAARLAKFAVPDDAVFVPQIPHNATGKVSKLVLRDMFKHHKAPPRSKM
ncbi:Medium-chain-fatty-acid--CoA ligase [Tetrabaena socialis]|uniref:Medium-chain-fatty-acid--CoA ligase n=1 Tax=Tetrabaena socialis TaxID=47790 RepID=A0A2J7ZXY3_9CHLO|nr:Medium-chain-fatty-acid--CoA ligase [Tetrabaena socialis]|eukprot:PNH05129.1 Medium-chain-fatty-acid--CoA ligase [Tetrabaena socialis]